jgi:hypothetical protein
VIHVCEKCNGTRSPFWSYFMFFFLIIDSIFN